MKWEGFDFLNVLTAFGDLHSEKSLESLKVKEHKNFKSSIHYLSLSLILPPPPSSLHPSSLSSLSSLPPLPPLIGDCRKSVVKIQKLTVFCIRQIDQVGHIQ